MNEPFEMVSVPAASLLAGVSAESLARALLVKITQNNGHKLAPAAERESLPPIGTECDGAIYAGLSIADNSPIALWLLPGDENLPWKDAVAWAEKQGGVLPSRIDQLVLFKNLNDHFQPEWYWSGAQYAGFADYAWVQNFDDGTQRFSHESDYHRARAVRRVVL